MQKHESSMNQELFICQNGGETTCWGCSSCSLIPSQALVFGLNADYMLHGSFWSRGFQGNMLKHMFQTCDGLSQMPPNPEKLTLRANTVTPLQKLTLMNHRPYKQQFLRLDWCINPHQLAVILFQCSYLLCGVFTTSVSLPHDSQRDRVLKSTICLSSNCRQGIKMPGKYLL